MNTELAFTPAKNTTKPNPFKNHTFTANMEREQLGDQRNDGESNFNSGDGTGQMAQPWMFMFMMMMMMMMMDTKNMPKMPAHNTQKKLSDLVYMLVRKQFRINKFSYILAVTRNRYKNLVRSIYFPIKITTLGLLMFSFTNSISDFSRVRISARNIPTSSANKSFLWV
jgi:hypothetical protein